MPLNLQEAQYWLNNFAAEQWDKTIAFLRKQFGLSRTECEDIFQESFFILYGKITDGTVDDFSLSLSTYFNKICRNKAHELLRYKGREVNIIDEYPNSDKDDYDDERIDRLLDLEGDDEDIEARKEKLVRQIVEDLPSPCNELLWGVYRDGFSMKTLADMYNYRNENTVKVVKHRCTQKFRDRFMELSDHIFG